MVLKNHLNPLTGLRNPKNIMRFGSFQKEINQRFESVEAAYASTNKTLAELGGLVKNISESLKGITIEPKPQGCLVQNISGDEGVQPKSQETQGAPEEQSRGNAKGRAKMGKESGEKRGKGRNTGKSHPSTRKWSGERPKRKWEEEDSSDSESSELFKLKQREELASKLPRDPPSPPSSDESSGSGSESERSSSEGESPKRKKVRRRERGRELKINPQFPTFHGNANELLMPYLNRLEGMFRFKKVRKSLWVSYASDTLKGTASTWFHQMTALGKITTGTRWGEFKGIIKKQFLSVTYDMEIEKKFLECRQGSKSVRDYHLEFTNIILEMSRRVAKKEKLHKFIFGLNPEILAEATFKGVKTMGEALELAERTEAARKFLTLGRARVNAVVEEGDEESEELLEEGMNCGLANRQRVAYPRRVFNPKRLSTVRGNLYRKSPKPSLNNPKRTYFCFICKSPGHIAKNCPKKEQGEVNACYNCGGDHLVRQCPTLKSPACFNCGKPGHGWRDCPEPKKPWNPAKKAKLNNVDGVEEDPYEVWEHMRQLELNEYLDSCYDEGVMEEQEN